MYVYKQFEPDLWTVGFYDPTGKWIPESDHGTKEEAAERTHFMNGGPIIHKTEPLIPLKIQSSKRN
jgi:hypothetical protein